MTLNELKEKNPGLPFFCVTDPEFRPYGKVVTGYDFQPVIDVMTRRDVPQTGNVYVACDAEMMATETAKAISEGFYGGMPIEIGYCNGVTHQLNALEYHKGTEINVACYDMVVLLAKEQDIIDNKLDASTVVAFLVPAGTAIEMYGTTLHYAPCQAAPEGYKSIVFLPDQTNSDLDEKPEIRCDEDALLLCRNKWLIAHPDSDEAKNGAVAGIYGTNWIVNI